MNRKERRTFEKKNKTSFKEITNLKKDIDESLNISKLEERLNIVINDLSKILNYSKSVDFKFTLLMDTLDSLGVCKFEDLKNTQDLYSQRDQAKKIRIKDLLQKDLSLKDCLNEIKEDPRLPSYQRLGIDPIKDLNINPFELAQLVRDEYPSAVGEDLVNIGARLYNLNKSHFGM